MSRNETTTQIQRALSCCCVAWALAGAVIALSAVPRANPDARWLVGLASVAFPAMALAAAAAVRRGARRSAGLFLLLSVGTPTYFLWVVNVPALLAGIALLTAPPLPGSNGWAKHTI
jgi:hypothetical protein